MKLAKQPKNQTRLIEIQDKMASFRIIQPFSFWFFWYFWLEVFDFQGQQSGQCSREPTRLWKGWIDQGGIPCPECQWLWVSQCGWNEAICWGHRYLGSYQVVSLTAVCGRLWKAVCTCLYFTVCLYLRGRWLAASWSLALKCRQRWHCTCRTLSIYDNLWLQCGMSCV